MTVFGPLGVIFLCLLLVVVIGAFISFHFLKIHHRSTVSTIMKIVFIVYHCCYYWSIIINFSDVFSVCFDILSGGWVPVDAPSSGYVTVGSFQANTSGTMVMQEALSFACLLYTSPSPRDGATSRMPSSA